MAVQPTLCAACEKSTRTIAGLCPNCGQAKSDGAVPGWISPAARRVAPSLADALGPVGPYVGWACVAAVIAMAVGVLALAGVVVAAVVVAIVVLVCLALAGLVS